MDKLVVNKLVNKLVDKLVDKLDTGKTISEPIDGQTNW